MLAALCHDFGKPATTAFIEGRIRSRGHDEAGARPTIAFLDRLKIHTLDGYDVRAQTVALVRDHLKPGEFKTTRRHQHGGSAPRAPRELTCSTEFAAGRLAGRNDRGSARALVQADGKEWFIARERELRSRRGRPRPPQGRHCWRWGLSRRPSSEVARAVLRGISTAASARSRRRKRPRAVCSKTPGTGAAADASVLGISEISGGRCQVDRAADCTRRLLL